MHAAYASEYRYPTASPLLRGGLLCVLAILLHGLPLLNCWMPARGFGNSDVAEISIQFTDSANENSETLKPVEVERKDVAETKTVLPPSLEIPVPQIQPPK